MTAQQKAYEIWQKMMNADAYVDSISAKQFSLIAVEEIISAYPHTYDMEKKSTKDGEDIFIVMNVRSNIGYWHEVKQEIEKL